MCYFVIIIIYYNYNECQKNESKKKEWKKTVYETGEYIG
jgi:hypothetical protein